MYKLHLGSESAAVDTRRGVWGTVIKKWAKGGGMKTTRSGMRILVGSAGLLLGLLSGLAAYLPLGDSGTCWIRDGGRPEYQSVNPDARVEVVTTILPAGYFCVYVRDDGQSTFVSAPPPPPTIGLLGAVLIVAGAFRGRNKSHERVVD